MLTPLIALLAQALIAISSSSFVVAWPTEDWTTANATRSCVHLTADKVVCTDGRVAGSGW